MVGHAPEFVQKRVQHLSTSLDVPRQAKYLGPKSSGRERHTCLDLSLMAGTGMVRWIGCPSQWGRVRYHDFGTELLPSFPSSSLGAVIWKMLQQGLRSLCLSACTPLQASQVGKKELGVTSQFGGVRADADEALALVINQRPTLQRGKKADPEIP